MAIVTLNAAARIDIRMIMCVTFLLVCLVFALRPSDVPIQVWEKLEDGLGEDLNVILISDG